jgi:hypothetical protein
MRTEKELQMLNTERKKDYLHQIMKLSEKQLNVIDKLESMLRVSSSQE